MSTSTATTGFNFFLDFDRQRQVFVTGNLHALHNTVFPTLEDDECGCIWGGQVT